MADNPVNERIYFAVITGDNAIQAQLWEKETPGINHCNFKQVPTFSVKKENFLNFLDPVWILADCRLDRSAPRWTWAESDGGLPPVQLPGYKHVQMTLETLPTYDCVGFDEYMSPRMRYKTGAGNFEQYGLPAALVKFADLDIPVPQPLDVHLVYQPNEALFADVMIGNESSNGSSGPPDSNHGDQTTFSNPQASSTPDSSLSLTTPMPPPPTPEGSYNPTPDTTPEDQDPRPGPSHRPDTPYPRRRTFQ